ncbi:phage tail tape measure protein [Pseudomonas vancouverensis]|uniref:Phage tail tape measure protein n=1 Tax=Pseudomonas vancouverensis TaxID=95300 RepID=A0A1H2MX11_PSEVA|nr:phage tail tape measure protein [Pseudomonas vancouverensis]KAB0489639.1 phage tail tape measure protein [Pseudomonas vancouverensis]TDB69285.1 phage tail tape measure protein [Pseudomonas vancouverensis]SDU97528.1 phage tail tape measure protein, lambda family [Pseudomonas vancouverensis]
MADTDVQGMLVRIEATTAQLRQEMARADSSVSQASGKIDKSLGRVDEAFDRAGDSAQDAAGLIKGALAAAVGAASISKIIATADSFGQMSDRIGMATGSVGEYNEVQDRLLETAQRTYRPLSEAQELYIRTADSLKSMGYNTGQALDVMDSFSFLLVTNSATADKASSAIDAYSKALQTGKVEADGWQSILAAMPSVVDTIAKATGQSAEEIRSLGAQGKLSLDVLTEGLQKSAVANGVLADSMSVSVHDALQSLSNAFGVYINHLNETSDFTGVLASGIVGLGENLGTLADVAIVAAIAALTRYGASAVGSAALAARSAYKDVVARKAQAIAVLLAAQAEQQKAQTTVFLAEKEAIAARGTAVQTQMSLQLAEARMVETRATNAVAAAQQGVSRAGVSLLGILGGPVGVATLALGAATAFLTLRDNSSVLEQKLGDLSDPLDTLTERFNKLNRATQSVTLRELRAEVDSTQQKLGQMAEGIADKFENDLRNMGAAGADGLMAGLVPLPASAQAALELVRQASKDQASGIAVDWKNVADRLREYPEVTEEMARAVESGQIKVSDLSAVLKKQQDTVAELTGVVDENTRAERENAAAKAKAAGIGQAYLDQLQKQLAAAQDKTALEAANRFIAENKDLTEGMVVAIRSAAAAKDAQKASDDAATKATKKNTSETESAAKLQLKAFESTEEGYKRQIELINTTGDKQKDATEVAKLSFELQEGKLGKLSEAQKKRLLGMAAELDALNKIKKANEDELKLTAFKNAQAVGTQTAQDGFDQDLAGIGLGDKARDRMRADLALRQKYATDLASLNEQRNTGQISPELYANETTVLEEELAKRLLAQQSYYTQLDEYQSNWMNGVNEAWANYADAAQNSMQIASDFTAGTLGSARSELGNFFSDVATGAKDADDAFGDMVGNFAKSLVNALADMAAQWLIYQGVQMLVGKTTQVSAAATMGANAQATALQAGLAAFASTAAIPIVGPVLAPAAMATALSITSPLAAAVGMTAMAGAGFMEGGYTGNGRRDEIAGPVHRGEYVFDAEATARIGVGKLEALSDGRTSMIGQQGAALVTGSQGGGQGSNDSGMNVEIHNYGASQVQTRRGDKGQLQVIIDAVREDFQQGVASGDSPYSRAIEGTYHGMRRGA